MIQENKTTEDPLTSLAGESAVRVSLLRGDLGGDTSAGDLLRERDLPRAVAPVGLRPGDLPRGLRPVGERPAGEWLPPRGLFPAAGDRPVGLRPAGDLLLLLLRDLPRGDLFLPAGELLRPLPALERVRRLLPLPPFCVSSPSFCPSSLLRSRFGELGSGTSFPSSSTYTVT